MRTPHRPSTHVASEQSASLVHVVLQATACASHAKGAHASRGGARHVPRPSHMDAGVSTFPSHRAGAQEVVTGNSSQLPTLPAMAQLRQGPSQDIAQHTPFAQNPLSQSIRSAHGCPICLTPVTTDASGAPALPPIAPALPEAPPRAPPSAPPLPLGDAPSRSSAPRPHATSARRHVDPRIDLAPPRRDEAPTVPASDDSAVRAARTRAAFMTSGGGSPSRRRRPWPSNRRRRRACGAAGAGASPRTAPP